MPYAFAAQLPLGLAGEVIPRALWPGKPVTDPFQVTQDYYGSSLATASAVTPQGDLWRYGGWVPVIAGMAFLGCLMRAADDVLDVRAYPQAALLLLLLWPLLGVPERGFTTMLATLPGLIVTWLAVTAAVFRNPAGAAAVSPRAFSAADPPTSVTCSVGAEANGGAAVTGTSATADNPGSKGNGTTFGAYC